MAAVHHTDEALDAARDVAHRGVGTASWGPDTDQPYRIGVGVYRWRYRVSAWRTRR